MAKIEKIGNIQIVDNKEDKFFYFPMISMACTGSGYTIQIGLQWQNVLRRISDECRHSCVFKPADK